MERKGYRSRSRSPGASRRRRRSRSPPRHGKWRRRSISPNSFEKRRRWESSGKPRKPCLLYAKGDCFRGEECWFLHDRESRGEARSERSSEDRHRRDDRGRRRDDRSDDRRRSRSPREDRRREESSGRSRRDDNKERQPNSPREEKKEGGRRREEFKQIMVSPESQTAAAEEVINEAAAAAGGVEERQAEQAMELAGSEDECILQAPPSEPSRDVVPGTDIASSGLEGGGGNAPLPPPPPPPPPELYETEQQQAMFQEEDHGGSPLAAGYLRPAEGGLDRRSEKEARALKVVRNAVTDYVKDLLKTAWKEGHLTKEAFKTIAQKAVDKVMSTLHGHEIPKGHSKVEQFMVSSQPKIAKLVQGYLSKYAIS